MSEKFETRGEIGHSLAGLRDQLAFQSKVLGAAVIMAVVALGLLFNQYSGLSLKFADLLASNSRAEAKIASMVTMIAEMESQLKQARAEQLGLSRLDRRPDGQLQAGARDRRTVQVVGLDLRHGPEGMILARQAGQEICSTCWTSGTKWRSRFWMPCFSVAVEEGQPAQAPFMCRNTVPFS